MSSNLKVNTILPSVGNNIGIGTVGGLINIVGNIDVNSTSGISTFNGLEISGIVTAKAGAAVTYYGDGSNLTNLPAQVTINNATANRVLTSDGGTTLNGEANLTFDGDSLLLLSSTNGRRVSFAGGGTSHYMKFDNTLNGIILNGYGGIAFETNGTNERLRIESDGDICIGRTSGLSDAKVSIQCDAGEAGIAVQLNTSSGASNLLMAYSSAGPNVASITVDPDASPGLMFNVWDGSSTTERLRIGSDGLLTATGNADFNVAGGELDIYSTGSGDQHSLRLLNSDASAGNKIGIFFGPANNVAGAYISGVAESDFTSAANRDAGLEFGTRLNATFQTPLKISAAGYITKPNQPSCMAYNASGQMIAGGATAAFNSTRFNIGSNYNTSNGRFTAPIAGRYLVAYSGLHDYQGQTFAGFAIQLNGSNFDGGEAYDYIVGSSNNHQCQLAKTLILNMNVNDYVSIYVRSSGSRIHQRYGSFSVCLLT